MWRDPKRDPWVSHEVLPWVFHTGHSHVFRGFGVLTYCWVFHESPMRSVWRWYVGLSGGIHVQPKVSDQEQYTFGITNHLYGYIAKARSSSSSRSTSRGPCCAPYRTPNFVSVYPPNSRSGRRHNRFYVFMFFSHLVVLSL